MVYNMKRLNEATRRDLIAKSKTAERTKSYGTTRYDRRNKQHVYDTVTAFNKIDMNALFKGNLLSFKVPVHGETNNYTVEILFEGIIDDIKHEIKANKDKLEYKCVYRAIINSINNQDIYVSCTCPDFKYRFAYWATKNKFNSGTPQVQLAEITNPDDKLGAGCKHIMAILSNLDWAMKLAMTIHNYILYMKDNQEQKFANVIYPVLYDMPYEKAVQLNLFDDDETLANTMDNEEDVEIIDKANERSIYKPEENTQEDNVVDGDSQLKLNFNNNKQPQKGMTLRR